MTNTKSKLNIIMPLLLFLPAFVLHTFLSINTETLLVNNVIASLIVVIAYPISQRLGVQTLYRRTLAAVVAGFYPAVLTQTKSAESAVMLIFPIFIAMILLACADSKKSAAKHFLSIFLSFAVTFMVFADSLLITVAVALIITVVFKRKSVSIAAFLISLIVLSAAVYYLTLRFQIEQGLLNFSNINITQITDNLYSFAVSTWGLGVLGVVLFIKHIRGNSNLSTFSIFAVLSVVFGLITDITGVTPLILIFTVCCIIKHDLDLRTVLWAVIALCGIFTMNFTDYITISAVFCVMATIIVIVCCARKYRTEILSAAITAISIGSCVYASLGIIYGV